MRNMSFALTTEQILSRTKTVTRRMGWEFLKPGDDLWAVKKCMGLKKGETVERLAQIRVHQVSRQPLNRMINQKPWGWGEVEDEGFKGMSPEEFVEMFCKTHKGCKPDTIITRIVFWYL